MAESSVSPLTTEEQTSPPSTSDQVPPTASPSLLSAIDDVVTALDNYEGAGTDETDPHAVREALIKDSAVTRELDRANALLAVELSRADLPSRADRGLDLHSISNFVNGVSHWVELDVAYIAGATACSPQWDAYALQNCLADNHAQFETQVESVWTEMQTAANECIQRRNKTLSRP